MESVDVHTFEGKEKEVFSNKKNIALIITAYKDIENLKCIIDFFSGFKIYLHVDKKSEITSFIKESDLLSKIEFFSCELEVSWGGFSHLEAIIMLMKEVSLNDEIEYIHIISGQDLPIVSRDELVHFSTENKDKIFMTCKRILDTSKDVRQRLYYRAIINNVNYKSKLGYFVKYIEKLQVISPRKKLGSFNENEIYKGMIWSSFPKSFLNLVVKQYSMGDFINDLKHTRIPEEFYLQTIAMNSSFRINVIDHNLRYTDWSGRYGSTPSYLDLSDIGMIDESGCLFARKVDSIISKDLRDEIISKKWN